MLSTHIPGIEPEVSGETSRAEIETLCILHAVGQDGCSASELAVRLGLPADLASAIVAVFASLITAGWLEQHDGLVRVSVAGDEHLRKRLTALARG